MNGELPTAPANFVTSISQRPSAPPPQRFAAEHGFTYLGILFVVAFIGVGLSVVGQLWSLSARRADEQQLLYVGDAYRRAIGSYFQHGGRFPQTLDELVLDTRVTPPLHHLRKLYPDPVGHGSEWRVIAGIDGGIAGVASQSMQKPLKAAHFQRLYEAFEKAECYCEWEFTYKPPARYRLRTR
jgi:type II secretory pathway pseudopilin PulG